MKVNHSSLLAVGALAAGLVLAGCMPKGGMQPVGPVPSNQGGPAQPQTIDQLITDRDTDFTIKQPLKSTAVVKYYDEKLLAEGWKIYKPKKADDPGQRKWLLIGRRDAPKGSPIGGYGALWQDPKTGRVAELNLLHRAQEKDVQYGTFTIYAKDNSPLAQGIPSASDDWKADDNN